MGNLLSITEIDRKASWYFEDVRWAQLGSNWGWEYARPSSDYPYVLGIKDDDLQRNIIRKWTETLHETVIFDHVDRSYKIYHSKGVNEQCIIKNEYWTRFHFSNEEDAVAFGLKFGEYITPVPEDPDKRV